MRHASIAAELNRWWALGARLALSTRGWLERQRALPARRRKRQRHRPHPTHRAPIPQSLPPDEAAPSAPRDRVTCPPAPAHELPPECEMVLDPRALVTPSQWVERKLTKLLGKTPLPVSRLAEHPKGQLRPRR
jgi:hypothetical protein